MGEHLLPVEWGEAPVDLDAVPMDPPRRLRQYFRLDNETRRRVPWGSVQSREPDEHERCELVLQKIDHYSHWYPTPDRPNSRTLCIGWHAFTHSIQRSLALFKQPYLRGQNSDVIHRSAHDAEIVWFPNQWHTRETQWRMVFWEVKVACKTQFLRNPQLLDARTMRVIEPTKPDKKLRLCRDCFPGAEEDDLMSWVSTVAEV